MRFVRDVFPLRIYATYAVLWTLGLEGSLRVLSGTALHSDWCVASATRAFSVLVTLLFLRIVDEQKDLEYDRVHHPERPLVRGSITTRELQRAMACIAALLFALNAQISLAIIGVLALDLAYAVFLLHLERRSRLVREGLFLNLALTYPVQLLLSVYIVLSVRESVSALRWADLVLLIGFAFAFLHFEFARKTAWMADADQRFYSSVIGPRASAWLTAACAAGASAVVFLLFQPWRVSGEARLAALAPHASLLFVVCGGALFMLFRRPAWPKLYAMGFLLSFYIGLVVHAGVRASPRETRLAPPASRS
ncbi:MAG TPA: hypothetical protein VK524_33075 [Polyangiaceae bacterium]|nr:hypothetical protein [Polyangiaceae bacterium]